MARSGIRQRINELCDVIFERWFAIWIEKRDDFFIADAIGAG